MDSLRSASVTLLYVPYTIVRCLSIYDTIYNIILHRNHSYDLSVRNCDSPVESPPWNKEKTSVAIHRVCPGSNTVSGTSDDRMNNQ